jgi:PAS domain S-box-containing protein
VRIASVIVLSITLLAFAGGVAVLIECGRRVDGHQRRLQRLMELATDAIVVMNDTGRIVAWNAGATGIFQWASEDAIGASIWAMLPEGHEELYSSYFTGLAAGTIKAPRHPVEIAAQRRDGTTILAELSVSTWREGKTSYLLTVFRDVSQRRLMEEQLRASTELFEGVLAGASETSIIATDENGRVTVFNRGAELLLGYDANEVCGVLDLDHFHDPLEVAARAAELAVPPGVEALVARVRGGEPETREWTYLAKDGTRIAVSLTVTAMTTDDTLRGFIAVARDLTAQRQAERRIEFGNEAFRTAFDSAPAAILLTRPDMTCAHASPAFCELTGFSHRELENMSMLELIVPDDDLDSGEILERAAEEFASLLQGRSAVHHSERRVRRADGSAVWVREHTSMVANPDGEPLLWVTHLEDITQEQRVQNALKDALTHKVQALDHLEEVARAKSDFVSMVSHELRSPVTSIIGYLELLADGSYGPLAPTQSETLGIVARNASRLEQLIADLLTLSRLETGSHAELHKAEVDIAAVVKDVAMSMRPIMAGRRQPFTLDIDDNIGWVMGDERQLEHVVTNLLTNASKFTPEGAALDVNVRRRDDQVAITVRDNGIGIAPEDLPKVFSRFFRGGREDVAKVPGTGLGLSIVRGIVKQHGGDVTIESELGRGTTVTVVLPSSDPAPAAVALELQRN